MILRRPGHSALCRAALAAGDAREGTMLLEFPVPAKIGHSRMPGISALHQ